LINEKGALTLPCLYDDLHIGDFSFSHGLTQVESNGKTGFINYLGYLVIPCSYSHASCFENGISQISDDSENKLGYINKSGVEYWED
jgi:hypothetical protein